MADTSPEKPDYFSRRPTGSAHGTPRIRRHPSEVYRPRLASVQSPGSPTSPRTPRTPLLGRSFSSNFASPELGFRQDDDYFVFEFSHRFLRAGLGGESTPRCIYSFGPEAQAIAGDYSRWSSSGSHKGLSSRAEASSAWAHDYELWQMDLRNIDLGLVGDKVERALRDAIHDQVLVLDDSKKRKAMLVVPTILPHPLLSLLCTKIFELYPPPPSITLLSSAIMSTIAAGLRSALVVDVGWTATTVEAICELRPVRQMQSSRGIKRLSLAVKTLLDEVANTKQGQRPIGGVSFADAEEVMHRMSWCRQGGETLTEQDQALVSISLPSAASAQISFARLADPVEVTFFDRTHAVPPLDEDELTLPDLLFRSLLRLPIDIREVCLRHIVFVGGGSNIPGLKARTLKDLHNIIPKRDWDVVENYGSSKRPQQRRTMRRPDGPVAKESVVNTPSVETNKDNDATIKTPAHQQPQLIDPVLARLRSRNKPRAARGASSLASKSEGQQEEASGEMADEQRRLEDVSGRPKALSDRTDLVDSQGQVRSIATLGAWTGASLLSGLRIPGLVEIERERFQQHGLHAGPSIAEEKRRSAPQQAQRQSLAAGSVGAVASSISTLGLWA